jgi:hypothetical protein
MSYQLNSAIANIEEKGKFANAAGNTECVEFIRQACDARRTTLWKKGINVMDAAPGTISRARRLRPSMQRETTPLTPKISMLPST